MPNKIILVIALIAGLIFGAVAGFVLATMGTNYRAQRYDGLKNMLIQRSWQACIAKGGLPHPWITAGQMGFRCDPTPKPCVVEKEDSRP